MEVFLVYLWLKLDQFTVLLALATASAIIAIGVSAINRTEAKTHQRGDARYYDQDYEKEREQAWNKAFKWSIRLALFFGLSAVVLPSGQQVAVLVGTHYAVQLAKSPEGEKVVSLIRKKANEYLDQQLKETK